MFDFDGFKAVNDHYGRAAGDAALVADAVRETVSLAGHPEVRLSVSVGVTGFGAASHPSASALLASADADMYDAKRRMARSGSPSPER